MAGKTKTRSLAEMAANPDNIGVRLLSSLATIPPEEIAAVVRGLLTATSTVRTGADSSITVPDHRAREAGVRLVLGYTLGLPVARSLEVVQRIEPDDGATLDRLLSSPAARAAIERELQAARPCG